MGVADISECLRVFLTIIDLGVKTRDFRDFEYGIFKVIELIYIVIDYVFMLIFGL